MRGFRGTLLACALSALPMSLLHAQQKPSPEAASWWAQTTALANDGMEGRDTGTEAYERAARYVAAQFAAAGLKPAGDNGTFFQRVQMHQVALVPEQSSILIARPQGKEIALHFTTDATTVPREDVSLSQRNMVFTGYGVPSGSADLQGKIAVFFNNVPRGLSAREQAGYPALRTKTLTMAGAAAILAIDNPAATEPFHWPAAYARSVALADAHPTRPAPSVSSSPLVIRLNPTALPALFGPEAPLSPEEILTEAGKGAPLPSFAMGRDASIRLVTAAKDIASPNILGMLPGSDPALAPEYVALSAHLDGYGFGVPVLGDNLYNGTLDDAAYVALLIEVAKNLHARAPARSILFCAFTGEEKGLLGSAWFTQHPTVPVSSIVADLNLDQLRPIFPLKILTMEGVDDSTLGATVKTLAAGFGIEIRPDREPERNLFRRADNYNFVHAGVPIASFIFGYDPGSPEEAIYRDWYTRRYHKPQDDLTTPIDWKAAATFNRFYEQLAVTIANAPARPTWLPGSAYAPKTER